ncbi:activator of HSP90 ATPase [Sphaerisporangium rufum]|uniref:Activator of HSP90 ATPase n=1 Tax=Sphaerisporangium rufum TaxID=1381558 RepID=A0A919V549_9ACTN|nr:SRPBCC family protein [Sphaerisporangium rufum]GII77940.1 activator of HSP90 ATPase [Sphaerisporangium rufum]
MIDVINQVNAAHREIGEQPVAAGPGRSLLLRRTYDHAIEEVWSACTEPDRIGRWLAPVSGDLRLGGTFQLEGNAGGEILRCEEPHLLKVTWTYGEGMATEVEVRLAKSDDGGTLFELEHASPAAFVDEMVKAHGPGGTIGIGTGWDLALLGLDLHLRGEDLDPATWQNAPGVKEFAAGSSQAWGRAIQQAWGTGDEEIAAAVAFATQFFAPGTGG